MLRRVTNALALLVTLGLAVSCSAQTVFVDTIGDGSNYQKGNELTHTLQAGFESYPASGDFTGVRPVYDSVNGVIENGTSGVPCAQIVAIDAQGNPYLQSGEYRGMSRTAVYAGSVRLYNRNRHHCRRQGFGWVFRPTPGFSTAGARLYLLFPIPAGTDSYAPIDISVATTGTQVEGAAPNIHVNGGQTYYAVVGVGTPGAWAAGTNFYFNLNWAWKSVVNDAAMVGNALYNNNNCNGSFVTTPGVLGLKISGETSCPPQNKNINDAKNLSDGTAVNVADVVISAESGAVGPSFYYVEDPTRCSGICVIGTTTYSAGDHITLVGTMTTVGVERAITQQSVSAGLTTGAVNPVGVVVRSLGGPGASTVGLLVRVAGTVTAGSPSTIDDGSATPVSVVGTVTAGDGRAVTGIVSLDPLREPGYTGSLSNQSNVSRQESGI